MVHILLSKSPYFHVDGQSWSTRNGSIAVDSSSKITTSGATFEAILRDLAVCLIWAIDTDDPDGKRIIVQLFEEVTRLMNQGDC